MGRKKNIRTEEEINQIKGIVLQSLREGISVVKMSESYGIPAPYIYKVRTDFIAAGIITKQEIEEAVSRRKSLNKATHKKIKEENPRRKLSRERKERVLELANQNYSPKEIANELGISVTYANVLVNKLIDEGKLEKKAKENRREERLQYIAEMVKQGHSLIEIVETNPEYTYARITPILKELIASGVITREQVEENKKRASARKKGVISEVSYSEQEQFVIEKVKEGYLPSEILKSDTTGSLNLGRINYYKRVAILNGSISKEEADNAMARRREMQTKSKRSEITNKIRPLVEQGYSVREACRIINYSYGYMRKMITMCRKENEWYSEEELKSFKAKREKKTEIPKVPKIRKVRQQHIDMREQFITLVKDGYTNEEIRKKLGCCSATICRYRKECIEQNIWFSDEELKEFRRQRNQKELEADPEKWIAYLKNQEEQKRIEFEKAQKKRESENRKRKEKLQKTQRARKVEKSLNDHLRAMVGYTTQGYTLDEIAKLMNRSIGYVIGLRKIYKEKNGKWFSRIKLAEFRKQRRKREEEERRAKEEATRKKEENKKIEENDAAQIIKIEIQTLIECVMQGYNIDEISFFMGCDTAHIRELVKEYKKNNKWFSHRVLKMFKEQRELREKAQGESEALPASGEKTNIVEEPKVVMPKQIKQAIKVEDDPEKIEALKRFGKLNSKIKMCRKLARREDRLDYNGEEDVSTTSREEFMRLAVEISKTGQVLPESDMNLVMDTLFMYPNLANTGNIKFLITNASKLGGVEAAHKMAIELVRSLQNTRYYEKLVNYRVWLKKKMLLPQMQEMKAKGMDSTAIGEKLGVSSAEVLMLLDGDEVDFLDE